MKLNRKKLKTRHRIFLCKGRITKKGKSIVKIFASAKETVDLIVNFLKDLDVSIMANKEKEVIKSLDGMKLLAKGNCELDEETESAIKGKEEVKK